MGVFKIVTTVLVGLMMFTFAMIWISTAKQKEYTWVWTAIEMVYICTLFAIWG